jgi:hypothetical protein
MRRIAKRVAVGVGLMVLASCPGADAISGPSFVNYTAPTSVSFYSQSITHLLPGGYGGTKAGETSIGVDPFDNGVLFQMWATTARVQFDDTRTPASARWTNVSPPLDSQLTQDPILWTDPVT